MANETDKNTETEKAIDYRLEVVEDGTEAITLDAGFNADPAFDPNSPSFDPVKFEIAQRRALEQMSARLASFMAAITDTITDLQRDDLQIERPSIGPFVESLQESVKKLTAEIDTMRELPVITDSLHYTLRNINLLGDFLKGWDEILPFLEEELTKEAYKGITLDEFLNNGRNILTSEIYLQAVRSAKDLLEHSQTKPLDATVKRASKVDFPLDKINTALWRTLARADKSGQIAFDTSQTIPVKVERQNSSQEVSLLFSINFDALGNDVKISKKLSMFDKRVYMAMGALYNAGNDVVTLRQIHFAMGNTGEPSQGQLEKIDASTQKMLAPITLDNHEEIEANYNYPAFKYDGPLLPFESVTKTINGKLVEKAMHLFREPPLISFARGRKQLTTLNIKVLESPINKTENNLAIDDYLLERISRAKLGKMQKVILISTLFEEAGITDKKKKQRAPQTIQRYMEHYKKCGFIKDYQMSKDKITFSF